MPIVSIQELKEQFEPGKFIRSDYFFNLIDTLADDRSAIYVGYSEPADANAIPLWFNDATRILSIFDGAKWVAVSRPDVEYTMPVEDGLPGQVLTTDGNGTVTWQDK